MTNSGWSALQVGAVTRTGPAAADFTIAFNGCDKRTLGRGESCPITITFAPGGSGDRVALLQVDHNGLKPPLTTALHGSASKAKVEIKPPVGRPGIVAIVTGSGFPPSTKVTLKWSQGITGTMPPIVTDAHGAFRVQMLVFRNDVIGPRDLVVGARRRGVVPAVRDVVPRGRADERAAALRAGRPRDHPPAIARLPLSRRPMPPETIVCSRCGTVNAAGDQFCGSCGAFLEWEGQAPPADEPPPPVQPTEAPAPEPPPTEVLAAPTAAPPLDTAPPPPRPRPASRSAPTAAPATRPVGRSATSAASSSPRRRRPPRPPPRAARRRNPRPAACLAGC